MPWTSCAVAHGGGLVGGGPRCSGTPGVSACLKALLGEVAVARPWRESLQPGCSQADPCREIWSLASPRGCSTTRSLRTVPKLPGLRAAGKPQGPAEPWSQCRLQSPLCTRVWKAVLSSPWWNVGLVPLSCILPRDLSFTMEFWVSLKCSVLVLPSLLFPPPPFPLPSPSILLCQTASSLCSPRPTCARRPLASARPESTSPSSPVVHWLSRGFFPRGLCPSSSPAVHRGLCVVAALLVSRGSERRQRERFGDWTSSF